MIKKTSPGVPPKKNESVLSNQIVKASVGDTISITLGQKIQVREYEPVSVNIGFTSAILPDESVEDAYSRIEKFVKSKIAKEIANIESAKYNK